MVVSPVAEVAGLLMEECHVKMRVLLTVLLSTIAASAMSTGEYLDAFLTHYKVSESSDLGKSSCGACHISDSDFSYNAYGRDMVKYMTDNNKSELDAGVLEALGAMDSDGDGISNGDDIAGGSVPGKGTATETAPKKKASFPPKNAYHPAIVHFPIALFIAGLLLDFFGMIRKDKTLLFAGWLNLVMAAVTAIGGILSGVAAASLMKLPYRGLIFDHMIYAVGSTALMFVMVAMRLHRHEKMNLPARILYYALAAGCFLTISWAGHLGGVLVYGE